MTTNDNKVTQPKPSFGSATIVQMNESIAMVEKNLTMFKPKSRLRFTFSQDDVVKDVFRVYVALEMARIIYAHIEDGGDAGPSLQKDYAELRRGLMGNKFTSGSDMLLTRLEQYLNKGVSFWRESFKVLYEADAHTTIDLNSTILQALDLLTFRLPNWLRNLKNKKIATIGAQFQYMDEVLSKPAYHTLYRYFVTDGYKSDILVKDKRREGEFWLSSKDKPAVPRIGNGDVRVFKINLSKGKKPFYTEIEFGSPNHAELAKLVPRITRELENEVANLKVDKTPASREQLDALAAKFAK